MKLNKGEQLFFGCKIDSKLREALSQAKPGDRRYFEDPASEFLRVCQVADERWIGKVVGGGVAVNDVDDIQRNVISILRRIAPNVRTSASSIRIFACEAADLVPQIVDDGATGTGEDALDDQGTRGIGPLHRLLEASLL
jgi:hypothetical protein